MSLRVPVEVDSYSLEAAVSVTKDGTLAVRPPPAVLGWGLRLKQDVTTLDRSGREVRRLPLGLTFGVKATQFRSADLLVGLQDGRDGTIDLSIINARTGELTPLTTRREFSAVPVLSPDETRVAYARQTAGMLDDIHVRDLKTGTEQAVVESRDTLEHPAAWSHDGRHLLFRSAPRGRPHTLQVFSFVMKTTAVFDDGPDEKTDFAAFSPDDRYVAYSTFRAGREEVVIATFPSRDRTWSVTSAGGRVLSWRADGRELIVATPSGQIVAYPLQLTADLVIGAPTVLIRDLGLAANFAMASPDHSEIIVRTVSGANKDRGEMRLLFGWHRDLRR